jgi:hypothetical protein
LTAVEVERGELTTDPQSRDGIVTTDGLNRSRDEVVEGSTRRLRERRDRPDRVRGGFLFHRDSVTVMLVMKRPETVLRSRLPDVRAAGDPRIHGLRRTPVAPYSQVKPYRLFTDFPLTAEIRYQPLPDLLAGHDADHWDPLTVPTTLIRADVPTRALTAVEVDVPARRFTFAHAGAIVVLAGAGGRDVAGMLDPPSAKRHAK